MKSVNLLLLFTVFLAFSFSSCKKRVSPSDPDPDPTTMSKLVTIKAYGVSGFYGLTDSNEKIFTGDLSEVADYTPKDGQRATMFYAPIETPVEGFQINAKVYSIVNHTTRPVVFLSDPANDTYGRDYFPIVKAFFGGGYLNVVYNANYRGELILLDNQVDPVSPPDGYIPLELRYTAPKERMNVSVNNNTPACFKLDIYDPAYRPGSKGLYIRCRSARNVYDYLTVDLQK